MPHLPGSAWSSDTLVGREVELSSLLDALDIEGSSTGHARAVLLGGDAGVGKTRLLTALRDRAFAEGWQVVAGHALDFGDSALPYLPFTEVIGRLSTERADIVEEAVRDHPTLNRLLPGRRTLWDPATGSAEPRTRSSSRDGDADTLDRAELYDGMLALLMAAAAQAPLLLVVEDLHWADRSTRDLLSVLLARPIDRVAVIASYRSDDLHRRHPLRKAVAEWARIAGVYRLQLDPLPPDAVRTLVRTLHPEPLTESAVDRIVARADGNAFFVEELVASSDRDDALPDDLAELLLVRLDQLGAAAEQVVRTASVAGRLVSHDLLAAASGLPVVELDEGLREAVERNVLVPSGSNAFSFRHALLGEAVYDDLLPGERVRLHAAYVTALGSGGGLGTAAELARHARLAHDPERAFSASVRAGDEAMSVGGPTEATGHFETALSLVGGTDIDPIDAADLVDRAVSAHIAAGNPPRAFALAERALAALPADASGIARAILATAAARAIFVAETTAQAVDFTTPALAGLENLPTEEAPDVRAGLLHVHARALGAARRPEEAKQAAIEALSISESRGLSAMASDVLATVAALERAADDGQESSERVIEAAFDEAATAAREARAGDAEVRALWALGRWRYDRGELDASAEAFERAYTRAAQVGMAWAPYGFDSRFSLVLIAHLQGDWDLVQELADVSGQAPPPIPEAMLAAGLLVVQAGRGQTDRLALFPHLRSMWEEDGTIAITAGPAVAEMRALTGDRDGAIAVHDDLVETMTRLWFDRFAARVRIAAITVGALASGIDGEPEQVRRRTAREVDRIIEGGHKALRFALDGGASWGPEGRAWAARMWAEHLRFRWLTGIAPPDRDDLVSAWEESVAAFEDLGHVHEVARSQARLAASLHGTDDDRVRELTEAARATASLLGAAPLLDELRVPTGGRERAPTGQSALTPREREILALVAAGRSNGEIGTQLFIATKTVSVHVSNILAKLDAASRTEAAAIARREGLLD